MIGWLRASSRTTASASSKEPSIATTRAPQACACASLPSATAPLGITTEQRSPARAAYAAADAEVFPVDAHTTATAPSSTAFESARVMPRSLNEPVGFWPSSLRYRSMPSCAPSLGACRSGVDPSPSETIGVDGVTGRRSR